MRLSKRSSAGVASAALALVLGVPAQGAIQGVSPGITLYTAPPTISTALSMATRTGYAWDEGTSIAFTGPMDFWPALGSSQSQPASFPAFGPGLVDSHYVYLDHFGDSGWGMTQTIRFDNPIVGVLFTEQNLLTTSAAPAGPWTTPGLSISPVPGSAVALSSGWYNTWGGNEGWVWISPSKPNVLHIELPVTPSSLPVWNTDSIEMRVLTATPAPGTVGILAGAGVLAARRRRSSVGR